MLLTLLLTLVLQIPAGAHSVDDHTRDEALATKTLAAETALEQRDYKTAETRLKTLTAEKKNDPRLLYDLGFAQEANNEPEAAAKTYAAAILAEPRFPEPRIALGLLDARANRTEAAHKELLEAAQLPTAAPELRARALRALAHLDETTHPADAREELLAAVKLTAETQDDIALSAALADHAGDSADAEQAYRRALNLDPADIDAATGLAHALAKQGKSTEAESILNAALEKHPDDPRIIAQLVPIYANSNRAKDAIALLESARVKDPQFAADPSSTRLLARLYTVAGNNEAAASLYTLLLLATPSDPVLLDDLGSAYVKLARYPEAQSTLAEAVALRTEFHDDTAWATAATHLAFAASRNANPQGCLQALAARATVLPNSPSSLFLEAISHDSLHQYKEAVRSYQAFLAIADGTLPTEEFQARHRLVALKHEK